MPSACLTIIACRTSDEAAMSQEKIVGRHHVNCSKRFIVCMVVLSACITVVEGVDFGDNVTSFQEQELCMAAVSLTDHPRT